MIVLVVRGNLVAPEHFLYNYWAPCRTLHYPRTAARRLGPIITHHMEASKMRANRIGSVFLLLAVLSTTAGPSLAWARPDSPPIGSPEVRALAATDPALAQLLAAGTVVTAVATGADHTCALTAGGGVKCWGENECGQLGDGTTTDRLAPVDVQGLGSGVTAIGAGRFHSCAVLDGGGVKCWGANYSGQLGDGTTTDRLTPVDVVGLSNAAQVAPGESYTCARTAAGGVHCWGFNIFGQLGDGTNVSRSTPAGVTGLDSGVTTIAAGSSHACALVAGAAKCWGGNSSGKLGDGTTTNRATPVDVTGLSGVVSIAAGQSHTCAALSDASAVCWGENGNGQLGDGTTTASSVPVEVRDLPDRVATVAAGAMHSCAVTPSGAVSCWGNNTFGQLGDGTTTDSRTPVTVSGLTLPVSGLVSGISHSCAVTSIGGVTCWGLNGSGQVGDGTGVSRPSPVTVVGLQGDDGTRYVMVPLVLKGYASPAPVEAIVTPADGGTITFTSPAGTSTTVSVPKGAVSETITLRYSPRTDAADAPYGMEFAGQAFALDALREGTTLDGFTFAQPVTVTVTYTDAQVQDVVEDTLALYVWDGSAWVDATTTCQPTAPVVREPEANALHVPVCHLSEFALFGEAVLRWTTQVADEGEIPDAEYCSFMHVSLQMGSEGRPHVAYYNVCYREGDLYRARPRYVRLTQAGWVAESLYHGSQNVGGFTSLALDGSDAPHISYYVFDNGSLWYYTPGEDSSLVEGSSGVGRNTSIALTSEGVPYISYYDGRFTLGVKNEATRLARKDGESWALETIDDATGDWGWGGHTSLQLDADGRPHVSYYDARYRDLRYAYRDGSSWRLFTVDSEGDVGDAGSLALDSGGRPHIAYYDATNGDLKYARWTESDWSIATVDSVGDVGKHVSLALDSVGNPHIAYYDATNHDLRYARWTGNTWETVIVDGEGSVGAYPSLALDNDDNVHIAYADGTNRALKYATTAR